MDERQLKGLCYNCDEKYFQGHKCKEIFFFMAISEEILKDDGDVLPPKLFLQVEDINMPFDQLEVEPLISGFSH
jgi:hypothetical protein